MRIQIRPESHPDGKTDTGTQAYVACVAHFTATRGTHALVLRGGG